MMERRESQGVQHEFGHFLTLFWRIVLREGHEQTLPTNPCLPKVVGARVRVVWNRESVCQIFGNGGRQRCGDIAHPCVVDLAEQRNRQEGFGGHPRIVRDYGGGAWFVFEKITVDNKN